MNLNEIGCEGVDWIHVTQDEAKRQGLANTVMNLRVTQRAGNFLTS